MSSIEIVIESLDDLLRCINLSSLLEVSGWPKPGNVHRTKNFKGTSFEHFLAGISAIQPNLRLLCKNVYSTTDNDEQSFSNIELGVFFKESVIEMMKWQTGGNVILGHILILAPLSSAASICIKLKKNRLIDFESILNKIIEDTTVNDTLHLYEAIKLSNPGGLGQIDKYDVNNPSVHKEIIRDEINLKEIFKKSQDYDLISREYANGFKIVLKEGLPYFLDSFKDNRNINKTIVNTFLKLLSSHLDTLIIRKVGKPEALKVSEMASKIILQGGISTKKGLKSTIKFDKKLQKRNGKLNPGTTADLLAGVIFCALLFGLNF
ncbi:MAG: triphosphoribosyl-dephospho-CoA synthase [Candidatus Lokiarchaeota archaeon]|nr:triphosphoribosyl-dephospho-CoA synthase [Candidatus Lokiarchaeota archaeon]